MYNNYEGFKKDFTAAHKKYRDGEIWTAYNVYLHALNNENKFCLMGRLADRDTIIGSRAVQDVKGSILLASDDWQNFLVTSDKQAGNVLKISDAAWSPAVNDAWTLGGIHGHSTFNVFCSTEFHPENIDAFMHAAVLGAGRYPLSVTGREMIGLMCCHEIYEPQFMNGLLLVAPLSSKPSVLSFVGYSGYLKDNSAEDSVGKLRNWLRSAKEIKK